MTIELPEELEAALQIQANARGVSVATYVRAIVERDLAPSLITPTAGAPLKTSRGVLAQYGPAPSAEEIDANRAEMFSNFGETF